MFLRKRINSNSRQLDRLYRSRLSEYTMGSAKAGAKDLSPQSEASSKFGATVAPRKAVLLIIGIAGLIGGVVAWQVLRPSSTQMPTPEGQQAIMTVDSIDTFYDASSQRVETKDDSVVGTPDATHTVPVGQNVNPAVGKRLARSSESVEPIVNAPVATKDFSSTPVTFDENIVFNDEHENFSNMDSIKNIGLAALMVLAMDTAVPAPVDTADYQTQDETELVTSSPKDQGWKTQFKRHEFTLGVGDPARVNYFRNRVGTVANFYPEVWLQNQVYFGNVYTSCPITLGYRFRVLKWLWVGGDVSYCGFFGSFKDLYTDQKVGDYRDHFISIMPAVRFSYLNREHFTLYSGIAGGVALEYSKSYPDYKAHNNHLAFQLTLFGVSAGSQRWFGFAELGCGFKGGYANAGFGFRFNAKK